MKAAKFDYERAVSLQQIQDALAGEPGGVRLMGGSQSLGPMLNLRLVRPERVLDVSAVPELQQVSTVNAQVRIGAAVTHAQIEDGLHEALRGHMMQKVAGRIAYRGVRNRGTLGGSLAHADPAADWVLTCVALGARVNVRGSGGTRSVPMADFMVAAYTTVLEAGEFIESVDVPAVSATARWGYYKFTRKVGEFADASCACYFDPAMRTARVVIGAMDGAPRFLPELAAKVAGHGAAALAGDAIAAALQPILAQRDPVHQELFRTVVERSLQQALGLKG
ncbi:MAG TPA: FAD binding domain-containing protein [Alcaligenes sp.]|nr:FAD binding domain-containing protein [Alcaligenes sp.]HRL26685.1 FAD binding domain-containing protein [Alcaligenes sp.]